MEHFLHGKKFPTATAIKTAPKEYFILKSLSFYKKRIESLLKRWAKFDSSITVEIIL
ncbi:hypothetical protein WN51_03112 [Melipona quadrifasciata]|uniref:Uncharacterized protein n=1 Tax=Melipona quadrifasciata TaxID=166423 RepID=A0A0N0BEX1_9HYME|nr:hypothetical protein WN51_03112 [Melipona quadrifasciata]